MTHGKPGQIGVGLARLQAVAAEHGVDFLLPHRTRGEARPRAGGDHAAVDIAVVLGGDGTVLRALTRFLGTGVPVVGVNFGRVGFLSSMGRRDLEAGLARVFAASTRSSSCRRSRSSTRAGWTGGQRRRRRQRLARTHGRARARGRRGGAGRQPCDGIICSTPSGSTAYNLSNGGPVLMWGLEAIALTYVAAHSLQARPS